VPKRILNLCFNISFSTPIVLILEPADDLWEKIHVVADGVIQGLPGRIGSIYFLGNTKNYPVSVPRDFRDHVPGWFSENRGRVSLIGPILERLVKKNFRGMSAVVCTRPPVDVDDWINTEIIKRVLFVRIGEEPFDHDINEINGRLGTDRIRESLENPPKKVLVNGAGFIPLRWEVSPQVPSQVLHDRREFSLKIDPSGERLELHIRALCGDDPPALYIERTKGDVQCPIDGKEEHSWFGEIHWGAIPEELRPVVEAGISKDNYRCPQCDREHGFETLLCPSGDLILKGMPLNTCLLFTRENFLALAEEYAFPLRNGQGIITKDGYLFEWQGGEWVSLGRIGPFDEVDDGVWALFHRI
jgi:hypothetical protein